jgi:hypothetical protein
VAVAVAGTGGDPIRGNEATQLASESLFSNLFSPFTFRLVFHLLLDVLDVPTRLPNRWFVAMYPDPLAVPWNLQLQEKQRRRLKVETGRLLSSADAS